MTVFGLASDLMAGVGPIVGRHAALRGSRATGGRTDVGGELAAPVLRMARTQPTSTPGLCSTAATPAPVRGRAVPPASGGPAASDGNSGVGARLWGERPRRGRRQQPTGPHTYDPVCDVAATRTWCERGTQARRGGSSCRARARTLSAPCTGRSPGPAGVADWTALVVGINADIDAPEPGRRSVQRARREGKVTGRECAPDRGRGRG